LFCIWATAGTPAETDNTIQAVMASADLIKSSVAQIFIDLDYWPDWKRLHKIQSHAVRNANRMSHAKTRAAPGRRGYGFIFTLNIC
jgi:hypothetical protein